MGLFPLQNPKALGLGGERGVASSTADGWRLDGAEAGGHAAVPPLQLPSDAWPPGPPVRQMQHGKEGKTGDPCSPAFLRSRPQLPTERHPQSPAHREATPSPWAPPVPRPAACSWRARPESQTALASPGAPAFPLRLCTCSLPPRPPTRMPSLGPSKPPPGPGSRSGYNLNGVALNPPPPLIQTLGFKGQCEKHRLGCS